MLTKELNTLLEDTLNQKVKIIKSISGGDISNAYYVKTSEKEFMVKTHSNHNLLKAEHLGLNKIAETNTIATPKIIDLSRVKNTSLLILGWIDTKTPTSQDFKVLGKQLAKLHSNSSQYFGLEFNNFIGHLHQSNKVHNNWSDFYREERLSPQLELAHKNGLLSASEMPSNKHLKGKCYDYFNKCKPSLLHGDLWAGNYLISNSGKPYLIDPSVYFGHSEVDIAMSKLFGGFDSSFYSEYRKIIPKDEHTDNRIELYQLYYLLVHLNMFGRSYYSSVKIILERHFKH